MTQPAFSVGGSVHVFTAGSPVIVDCLVEKHENCFPMIPSGKAHNEMLLGEAETQGVIDAKGSVLV